MERTSDSVAIVSGGLDSTTLVYDMLDKGYVPHMISFNYGQRHKKELVYARATATRLHLRHDVIDLTGLTRLISNSALTTPVITEEVSAMHEGGYGIEVPEGHYAEDTMKATVVPNRNMIMLSIATGIAVNEKARVVGIGVHAGDHFVYPDCRPAFLSAMTTAIAIGNEGFDSFDYGAGQSHQKPRGWNEDAEAPSTNSPTDLPAVGVMGALFAPFVYSSKADIAFRAMELGVNFQDTWSCYKGGEHHCGKCGTCVERLEAIDEAWLRYTGTHEPDPEHGYGHIQDGTHYEDTVFWRHATGITNE